jgi:hypothetical protein
MYYSCYIYNEWNIIIPAAASRCSHNDGVTYAFPGHRTAAEDARQRAASSEMLSRSCAE